MNYSYHFGCRSELNPLSNFWEPLQLERGRQVGDGRTLEAWQEEDVQRAMQDHFPEDYQIDSVLWTRRAVQALIEQVCEVKMPIRTVGEYLKRWGYTPKKPVERAYEQDPKAVQISRLPQT